MLSIKLFTKPLKLKISPAVATTIKINPNAEFIINTGDDKNLFNSL